MSSSLHVGTHWTPVVESLKALHKVYPIVVSRKEYGGGTITYGEPTWKVLINENEDYSRKHEIRMECEKFITPVDEDGNPTETRAYGTYGVDAVTYNVRYWYGCCALTTMNGLQLCYSYQPGKFYGGPGYPTPESRTGYFKDRPRLSKVIIEAYQDFINKLGEAILKEEQAHGSCHKMIFAFSDEEIAYQYWLAKEFGFTRCSDSFISYKTNNKIRIMELMVASEYKQEHAEEQYEARWSRDSGEEYDEDYGDEPADLDEEW